MVTLYLENTILKEKQELSLNLIAPILLVSHLKISLLKNILDITRNDDFLFVKLKKEFVFDKKLNMEERLNSWYLSTLKDIEEACLFLNINKEIITTLIWILNKFYIININYSFSRTKSKFNEIITKYSLIKDKDEIRYIIKNNKTQEKLIESIKYKKIVFNKADKLLFISNLVSLYTNNYTELTDSLFNLEYTSKLRELLNNYSVQEKQTLFYLFPTYPIEKFLVFNEKKSLAKNLLILLLDYLKDIPVDFNYIKKVLNGTNLENDIEDLFK